MICVDCRAALEPEDGHGRCPSCLGMEHLSQGSTEHASMNCSCLSVAARAARQAQLEGMLIPKRAQKEPKKSPESAETQSRHTGGPH